MTLEVVTLRDDGTGSTARVLPGYGFNCFSFCAAAGEPVEVLWADPEFAGGQKPPARSGIPLLFPFAGRIRGASYRYQGRNYNLRPDAKGNAIHGFVLNRPWRVIDRQAARVTGQFQASLDDSALLDHWPADFRITVAHSLTGNSLATEVTVDNPDTRPLPFGFGAHGYYRVPVGRKGDGADCRVVVPAMQQWELVDMLPTGRRIPAEHAAELAVGMPFGRMQFDHVLCGLQFAGGKCVTRVVDPQSGRTVTMTFGEQFPVCVLFNPAHREAVCVEPYTTVPDGFWLLESGFDPSLRVLAPGERFQARLEVRLD